MFNEIASNIYIYVGSPTCIKNGHGKSAKTNPTRNPALRLTCGRFSVPILYKRTAKCPKQAARQNSKSRTLIRIQEELTVATISDDNFIIQCALQICLYPALFQSTKTLEYNQFMVRD